jgi:hypothetical protein
MARGPIPSASGIASSAFGLLATAESWAMKPPLAFLASAGMGAAAGIQATKFLENEE